MKSVSQVFVIVNRNLENEIKVHYTNDIIEAICIQKGLIVGADPSMLRNLIKENEVNEVISNLERAGKDRLANDEEEAYIFFLPKLDKFR